MKNSCCSDICDKIATIKYLDILTGICNRSRSGSGDICSTIAIISEFDILTEICNLSNVKIFSVSNKELRFVLLLLTLLLFIRHLQVTK